MKKESIEYSLYGDLDGMSVSDLRRLLDDYPEDAVIDVRSETLQCIGGPYERIFFVFKWKE